MGLTPEEKQLYSQLFKALDPEGSGIVTGEKSRSTFEKSGLPPNILGEIWQLADHNNLGFLTQFGFCFAMRLIGYTQAGHYPLAQLAENPGPLPRFSGIGTLKPQSTSSSLLQTQPSSVVPLAQQQQPAGSTAISPVSPADYERFSQMYVKTTGLPSTLLEGSAARDILLRAKLPTPILGQIWGLVDTQNRGSLDLPAFVMAMHLIHGLLSGSLSTLPPFLPQDVWRSVEGAAAQTQQPQSSRLASAASQNTVRHVPTGSVPGNLVPRQTAPSTDEWTVTPQQKQQFDAIFDLLDKDHGGVLGPDQVALFLMTSRLDQQDLALIWDLADVQNSGNFSKLEFGIALFLVNRKRAGHPLPNVVPESLVSSLKYASDGSAATAAGPGTAGPSSAAAPRSAPVDAPVAPPAAAPKSSYDELADIFSQPTDTASQLSTQRAPSQAPIQSVGSSSDLSTNLPKVRSHLTSSFKPLSTFGQSLLAKEPTVAKDPATFSNTDLIGSDVKEAMTNAAVAPPQPFAQNSQSQLSSQLSGQFSGQNTRSQSQQAQFPTQQQLAQLSGQPSQGQPPQGQPAPLENSRTVDYEALRSVPPPPPKTRTVDHSHGSFSPGSSSAAPESSPAPAASSPAPVNRDLLADREVSGQLGEASSDIANLSNQIRSLTTRTSELHEKKSSAEQELARILKLKSEIDGKLTSLRASYTNETKQLEQVEANLTTAREDAEALRSEASITEAKLNNLSAQLHEKQVAVEELQKNNSTMRERLGYLNAEIAEAEKSLESKNAELVRLSNENNVKKSQIQVSIVKLEDVKREIKELEELHERQRAEYERLENERIAAEQRAQEAHAQHQEVQKREIKPPQTSTSGLGSALSAVAGAAIGGAAALGAGLFLHEKSAPASPEKKEPIQSREEPEHFHAEPESVPSSQNPVDASIHEADNLAIANSALEPSSVPGDFGLAFGANTFSADSDSTAKVAEHAPLQSEPSVSALVDEVIEKPTEDMTGVDEFSTTEHAEQREQQPEHQHELQHEQQQPPAYDEYSEQDFEDLKNQFPEVNSEYEGSAAPGGAATSSAVTDSYRHTESADTPVTSPDNSEYRFQSSGAGVIGGMVGMPGVLVGVQRTDSLTSSVQNNASLLVRDDNIGEVSDRATLNETPAPHEEHSEEVARPEESSEGERISSGVELFEIVNADDAKEARTEDRESASRLVSEPESTSRGVVGTSTEEFPPIKELDYDESSSSDEEGPEEKFDDAVENISPLSKAADDFDAEFDDLEPAAFEKKDIAGDSAKDDFDDDFNNLTAANADNRDEFEESDVDFDDNFTGSAAPDFSQPATALTGEDNDEWDQLFAGFGNAPPPAAPAAAPADDAELSRNVAVDELVGMGFDEQLVVEALEKVNWDTEAATNYLLDHA